MYKIDKIFNSILKINPDAKVAIKGDDVDTCEIDWRPGTSPISKEDIKAQFPAVEFDNAMENLRTKRNDKLAETDFHGLSDNSMSAEMTTYRQELRDLTNGVTTVEQAESVVFPTKP
jgi:hypothetical protein